MRWRLICRTAARILNKIEEGTAIQFQRA
jgi:hypothetical protein